MNIKTKEVLDKYIQVHIEAGNTTIDLGYLTAQEARYLLTHLTDACGDLEKFIIKQEDKEGKP
jgi:hypothetical protein